MFYYAGLAMVVLVLIAGFGWCFYRSWRGYLRIFRPMLDDEDLEQGNKRKKFS